MHIRVRHRMDGSLSPRISGRETMTLKMTNARPSEKKPMKMMKRKWRLTRMRSQCNRVPALSPLVRCCTVHGQYISFYDNFFPLEDSVPPASEQPSARLLCTNLPQEVTNDVLSVLFQQ